MRFSLLRTPAVITLLLAGGLVGLLAGLRHMAEVLAPIFLAYTVAVALLPIVERLERRGLSRGLAVAGVFLTAVVVAALVIGLFLQGLNEFARRLPQYHDLLEARFAQRASSGGRLDDYLGDVMRSARDIPTALTRATMDLITSLLNMTASVALFLLILLTMSLDLPGLRRTFHSPTADAGRLDRQMQGLLVEIQTYFRLQTLGNLVSAVAVTVAYGIFGVDFALLWGLLTFFLGYIPRFGMVLSFIPPLIMAFIEFGLERALVLLVVSIVLNGLMDNVITPMLSKKGLALRSLTVLVSSLVWMWVFGPIGAMLATPMTLVVRKLFESSEQTLSFAYAISTKDFGPDASRGETAGNATPPE